MEAVSSISLMISPTSLSLPTRTWKQNATQRLSNRNTRKAERLRPTSSYMPEPDISVATTTVSGSDQMSTGEAGSTVRTRAGDLEHTTILLLLPVDVNLALLLLLLGHSGL